MVKDKMDKEFKKQMDREYRQYWLNKKKIEKLEQEMLSASQENLQSTSTRTILYLKQRIVYIENAISQLKPFEKEVFDLIFEENRDWLYCEVNKNISKSAYYNIYNKAIRLLAEEWGEI